MYLGEIVRRVLVRMAENAALFGGLVPEKLLVPFSLRYKCCCFSHSLYCKFVYFYF